MLYTGDARRNGSNIPVTLEIKVFIVHWLGVVSVQFSTSDNLKISFVQLCDNSTYFNKHLLSVFGQEAGDKRWIKQNLYAWEVYNLVGKKGK